MHRVVWVLGFQGVWGLGLGGLGTETLNVNPAVSGKAPMCEGPVKARGCSFKFYRTLMGVSEN